jgi:hypothetical protein
MFRRRSSQDGAGAQADATISLPAVWKISVRGWQPVEALDERGELIAWFRSGAPRSRILNPGRAPIATLEQPWSHALTPGPPTALNVLAGRRAREHFATVSVEAGGEDPTFAIDARSHPDLAYRSRARDEGELLDAHAAVIATERYRLVRGASAGGINLGLADWQVTAQPCALTRGELLGLLWARLQLAIPRAHASDWPDRC